MIKAFHNAKQLEPTKLAKRERHLMIQPFLFTDNIDAFHFYFNTKEIKQVLPDFCSK